MPDSKSNQILPKGEALPPQRYWNPDGVPFYRKPVIQVLSLGGAALVLFSWFLSVRGYQSVITSRIILISVAICIAGVGHRFISCLPKYKNVTFSIFLLVLAVAGVVVDLKTIPNQNPASSPPKPEEIVLTAPMAKDLEAVQQLIGDKDEWGLRS
jgi:hypothetical protein